jgi:Ca-activated chloride channel family protein
MIQLEHPELSFLFLLLPLLLAGFTLLQRWRQKTKRLIGDEQVVKRLFSRHDVKSQWVKFGIWCLGIGCLLLALLNPQWGSRMQTVTMNSSDIVIALDISQSLRCRDVQPNRLERAKSFASDALDAMRGHKVGLLFFAGQANMEAPLTDDYELLGDLIRIADPDMASQQGTSVGAAIRLAMEVLGNDARTTKGLLIISDGETHDEDAIAMAKTASKNGIHIWTAGVGTREGDIIPIEVFGNQDYKRDESGNPVKTALNEKILLDIAAAANGVYWNINQPVNIEAEILREMAQLDTRESAQQIFDQRESRFQYILAAAILLLLLEWFFPFEKKKATVITAAKN